MLLDTILFYVLVTFELIVDIVLSEKVVKAFGRLLDQVELKTFWYVLRGTVV